MTITAGVDPGLYGAVAIWDDVLGELVLHDAPIGTVSVGRSKERAVLLDAAYANILRGAKPDRIVLEQVGGITGQSASASFNFGASFGLVRGIAAGLQIPLHMVTPYAWRTHWRVRPGKDGSRLCASQMMPTYAHLFSRAKDDGRAEATLLARYPVPG